MAISLASLKKVLHKGSQFEACSPVPLASAAGSFVRSLTIPAYNIDFTAFCVNTTSGVWLYNRANDAYLNILTGAIAGTFGAGACGRIVPLGPSGTATAGSTTTLTTALTINQDLRGFIIRITGGPGAGDERVIKSNTLGANAVITVNTAFSATITTSSTFQLITPRLWIVNPAATPGLGYYDWALNAWTTGLSVSGLTHAGTDATLTSNNSIVGTAYDWAGATHTFNAATATTLAINNVGYTANQWQYGYITIVDGTGAGQTRMIASNTAAAAGVSTLTVTASWSVNPDATSVWILAKPFDSGGAAGTGGRAVFASATNTTNAVLTVTGTAWTTNQWANWAQLRCIAGTNAGQVKAITANTSTTVTVSGVFTATLDATSVWVIEGSNDNLWLAGNAAVALFKYSISGNTWSTVTPSAARATAPGTGMTLAWIYGVQDSAWTTPDTIKNGRYMYSFRGGASAALDIYDMSANVAAGGTWISGQAYGNSGENFTAGASWEYDGYNRLYLSQYATLQRIYYYDLIRTALVPMATVLFPSGTAIVGDKLFSTSIVEGATVIPVLYQWKNTGQELHRLLVWQGQTQYPTFP